MNYWLAKSEPETFSWDDLLRMKISPWDGVRNYQARNNLQAMKNGDIVFFYHSGKKREIVGQMKVIQEAYPDPTSDDPRWKCVDFEVMQPLVNPVSLAEIKANSKLEKMPLVTHMRLSVMPVSETEYREILKMARENKG